MDANDIEKLAHIAAEQVWKDDFKVFNESDLDSRLLQVLRNLCIRSAKSGYLRGYLQSLKDN